MRSFAEIPVEYLKGVGPKRAETLQKELEIFTFGDLLQHFPFRYVDRSKVYAINEIPGELAWVQIRGKIMDVSLAGKPRQQRLMASFTDGTGMVDLIWFKGIRWIAEIIKPGQELIVFGKPNLFKGRFSFPHPEITLPDGFESLLKESFQGVYNTTEKLRNQGLDSRGISKIIRTLLSHPELQLPENLPEELKNRLRLMDRAQAFKEMHFPSTTEAYQHASLRLKFEELFFVQLWMLKQKVLRKERNNGLIFSAVGDLVHRFYKENLPFDLTQAQKRVIREIRKDLGSGKQMNRLLQGDVGSGKTLVALMSMLIALDNGYQACMMAPTEILAQQHYRSIIGFLGELPVKTALLTGSTKAADRRILHESLQTGELQLLVGTHALIEDTVIFEKLGLVVIDEQHRFGVEQRARLWDKGDRPPHVMVMTATPIPRTLAMTFYGNLDYSVIDEMPPGRKPVKTVHFFEKERERVHQFMRQQIAEGRQIYIVYPLISESETLDLKALELGFENITAAFPEPDYKVSMVHGRLKPREKEMEMQRFLRKETHIMVATTVIEVGVDVPNASVMVIENAERFGLSQMHQLRGRVGRGAEQSYCILMTGVKLSHEARERLRTMVQTTDGFVIADADLRLRGPGDVMGTRQSGNLDLKLADLIKDEKILRRSREEAQRILDEDPDLRQPAHTCLVQEIARREKRAGSWSRIL
ncbi:MAG: ATP-dependent DNA helicase RecG [Lentimicrobiaceae bacterium]|nr:ATP-dependent DNA helicase RecG [Lentimicrobiaceae bacterium]